MVKSTYKLPSWKKIQFNEGRKLSNDDLQYEAARVYVGLLDKRMKDVLLRIDVDLDFDQNVKMLTQIDVKLLQEVVETMAGNGAKDGLVKEGLIYKKQYIINHDCVFCKILATLGGKVDTGDWELQIHSLVQHLSARICHRGLHLPERLRLFSLR